MSEKVVQVLKVTVYECYECYCEWCDWTETRAAGDPDAGSNRQAWLNALRAAREHRRTHGRYEP